MRQRLLVPLDGSPFGAQVIPYAALLARRCGAGLLFVRAIEVDAAPRPGETGARTREITWAEAQRQLDEIAGDAALSGLPVQTQLELGQPARVILRLARERQVSLIVMATRRHVGASRWSVGSVAGHVLRQTHLPVLLLTPAALAVGGPERLEQPLLVPLDGSELSARILPVARELASCLHVPVTLVQALAPESFAGFAAPAVAPYGTDLQRASLHMERIRAWAGLEAIAERWRQGGVTTDVVVEVGAPVAVIDDVAGKTTAGWLAMASHGRGGLSGLLLGSTALRVLQRTALPVLIAAAPALEPYRLGEKASEPERAGGKPNLRVRG